MHEYGVTKNIIKIIIDESKKNNIDNIKKICLDVGELTGYKVDPIHYYFNILKKENDLLKKTQLDIKQIQGKIRCKSCNKCSTIKDPILFFCPVCDSSDVKVINGKEFIIQKIIT